MPEKRWQGSLGQIKEFGLFLRVEATERLPKEIEDKNVCFNTKKDYSRALQRKG